MSQNPPLGPRRRDIKRVKIKEPSVVPNKACFIGKVGSQDMGHKSSKIIMLRRYIVMFSTSSKKEVVLV